jgi:DNA invertase Pin-like site-specific DNA recombinase
MEASRVRELKAEGMRPVDIAKALQIGRASVYRVLGQKANNGVFPQSWTEATNPTFRFGKMVLQVMPLGLSCSP